MDRDELRAAHAPLGELNTAGNFFVAFPTPEAARRSDEPEWPEYMRPLEPADLHLTIAFFGRVGIERARLGMDAAAARAAGVSTAPGVIELDRLALLGGRRPTAVTRVSTAGEGTPQFLERSQLSEWIRQVRDAALEAAGLGPEKRPPLPHVTVARLRRKVRGASHDAAREWVESQQPPPLRVTMSEICLYGAASEGSDRRYVKLDRCPYPLRAK